MKLKKIMIIALSAIMTLSLGACGSSASTSSTTKKKIVIWAWDDTFNVLAAKEAKAVYQKTNKNVDVQVVSMSQDDIVQKLNTDLSSNVTTGLPDIVLIEDYRSQNFLKSYPDSFKDITKEVKISDFMDYKVKSATLDGKTYGVPFDSGVAALFYRTDLIEQAGYTKKDMENLTWDKFIEIGKAVKAKTGKLMVAQDPADLGIVDMMLQSAGQWYVKSDGKTVNLQNNVALKSALSTYKRMQDAGIVKPISGWNQTLSAFQSGDVAAIPSGCWMSSSVVKSQGAGKWAATEIPRLADVKSSVNYSNTGGSAWYVLSKAQNPDGAADFLGKTFASDKTLLNTLADKINLVSTLKTASTGSNYNKAFDFYGGQKILQDFSAWAKKVPSVNYGLYTRNIQDILKVTIQSVVKNNANIDSSLNEAQKQAEAAVSK